MQDILRKLRKYEIVIRKAINSQMQGDFHSIFKGAGIEFDDVRPYQYGDDVRTIDWNVSAKGHGTFVKTFKEEKEQTVFFLLDVSASQEIGRENQKKIDVGKEIAGVLTLAAIKQSSQVGILCYSDRREKYVRSGKGSLHAYQIIEEIFSLKPASKKTDINGLIKTGLQLIKKRSVVVLISDFIDENYENNLKGLAKRHDLVVIHLSDPRETVLPGLGIIPVLDKESGKTIWINTSSASFKSGLQKTFVENKINLEQISRKFQANYLAIDTSEDYIPKLIKLFELRNKKMKNG
jgi:uncharacterized protein (DUF58 family)